MLRPLQPPTLLAHPTFFLQLRFYSIFLSFFLTQNVPVCPFSWHGHKKVALRLFYLWVNVLCVRKNDLCQNGSTVTICLLMLISISVNSFLPALILLKFQCCCFLSISWYNVSKYLNWSLSLSVFPLMKSAICGHSLFRLTTVIYVLQLSIPTQNVDNPQSIMSFQCLQAYVNEIESSD